MFKGVIYISSTNRSGSTLLDLLLGEHKEIASLGEVHHFGAYIDKPGYRYYSYSDHPHPLTCLCGKRVFACKFWSDVEKELQCSLTHLKLDPNYIHQKFNLRLIKETKFKVFNVLFSKINKKIILQWHPNYFLKPFVQKITGYSSIASNYFKLYRAAAFVSESSYVVDSSKSPFRFQYLNTYNSSKIKIILLCRDPKSVVASMVKRGKNIALAIEEWNIIASQMELFSSNIPSQNIIRIRYEDLCLNTQGELRKICNFLELPFCFSSIKLSTAGKHHIAGSPAKFKLKSEIHIDESYKDILKKDDIKKICDQTKTFREIWGY